MSGGNRYAYAALGLVAGIGLSFLFLVWAVPEFRGGYPVDHTADQQAGNPQGGDASTNEQPDEPQWRHWSRRLIATEDTLAQWIMAFFAITATGLSLLGLVWLRATWREAKRSADAAERTANDARRIGRAQTRAYLTCTGGTFAMEKIWAHVWITIANKGQSPAFDVKVKAAWSVMALMAPGDATWKRVDGKPTDGETEIIPAGGVAKMFLLWNHSDIGTDAYDMIRGGAGTFNIDGKLSWTDVFSKEHSISFSAQPPLGQFAFQGDSFDRKGELEAYNRSSYRQIATDNDET